MANLIDAGGSGAAYARGVVAQAQAAILPEVRRLIDESIGRIAVRAGGNLAAIGIRSALMFDPAATAVVDDPDHEQVIVPLSGSGSYVYVGRQAVTGSPATLIEFTVIPTGAADLVFRGKVKYSVATTNSGHEISLRFNADDGSDYNYSRHRHGRVNSVNVHDWSVCDGGTFEDHVGIGRAPGSDSQAWDVATFEVTLLSYDENDGFAKTYYGRSFFSYHLGDTQVGYDTHGTWAGGFGPTALGPITRVTFGIAGVTDPFAVGSYVDMWKILPS